MEVNARWVDRVAILDLEGPMTVEADFGPLHGQVERILARGVDRLVLNLAGVGRLDACGIGQLVLVLSRTRESSAGLRLANVSRVQKELLDLVQLLDTFEAVEAGPGLTATPGLWSGSRASGSAWLPRRLAEWLSIPRPSWRVRSP